VIDSACGYSAYTLMPVDAAVLTIELKVNLLATAKGQRFRFIGHVVKAGRTISNVRGEAFAIDGDREKLIATMDGTMMTVAGRAGMEG
jgi:acyl-coenzyme A thioesterase PaaI-like protein